MNSQTHGFEAGTSPPGGISRDDFDKWIVDNYRGLVTTARRRFPAFSPDKVEEAVQGAVMRALETANYERCDTNLQTWFLQAVRSVLTTNARSGTRAVQAAVAMQKVVNPSCGKRTPRRGDSDCNPPHSEE
jgi:DNA-directed RNA polymerase specialized sigma24 family protein